MKLLFIDTETGGLDESRHSLLTIGLVVWEDSKIIDEKEILISKEKYSCVQQALDVNKINLDELRKNGVSEINVIKGLEEFCDKNFGKNKVTIAGHNTAFDVAFIRSLYKRNKAKYYLKFNYRILDTACILKFMYMQGKFDSDISTTDKAFEYFNIKIDKDKRHTALGDALATAELFTLLLKR